MLQCHPDPAFRSLECPKRGQKPGNLPFLGWTAGPFSEEKEMNDFLKMKKRCRNVYENKGSYALKTGMLLKRKEVGGMS